MNEAPRSFWSRLLAAPPPFDTARAAQKELQKVTNALGAAHVPVSLVDRTADRVYQNAFRRVATTIAAKGPVKAAGAPAATPAGVSALPDGEAGLPKNEGDSKSAGGTEAA